MFVLLKTIFPNKRNLTQVAKQLLGQLPSPTPPALARLAMRRREVTLVKMVMNKSDLVNLVTLVVVEMVMKMTRVMIIRMMKMKKMS